MYERFKTILNSKFTNLRITNKKYFDEYFGYPNKPRNMPKYLLRPYRRYLKNKRKESLYELN